jgi:hypothetical protein
MRGAIPPFLQYVFMAWCLVKHRNFTFTFIYTAAMQVPFSLVPLLSSKLSAVISRSVL